MSEKENKFNAIELNDEDLLDVAGGFKKQSRLNLKSEQTKRCNKCSKIFSTAQGSTCPFCRKDNNIMMC